MSRSLQRVLSQGQQQPVQPSCDELNAALNKVRNDVLRPLVTDLVAVGSAHGRQAVACVLGLYKVFHGILVCGSGAGRSSPGSRDQSCLIAKSSQIEYCKVIQSFIADLETLKQLVDKADVWNRKPLHRPARLHLDMGADSVERKMFSKTA